MKKFDLVSEKRNTLTNINAVRRGCVAFNVHHLVSHQLVNIEILESDENHSL